MDLPTYTNIWRIEKRLYKLYDLRLPMPLPIVWIGVFVGVLAPWSLLLWAVGVPLAVPWHVLYLVPPGIVTWLSTRPVIENKRLTELMESHLRYMGEPRSWSRMAPVAEPETITFSGRVWQVSPVSVKAPRKARHSQRTREAVPASARSTPPTGARETVPTGARETASGGPREVRPAVAAAAAAATHAPVAEAATPRREQRRDSGWGSAQRRGTAPALGAAALPQVKTPQPTEDHKVFPVRQADPQAVPARQADAVRQAESALQADSVRQADPQAVPARKAEPVQQAEPVVGRAEELGGSEGSRGLPQAGREEPVEGPPARDVPVEVRGTRGSEQAEGAAPAVRAEETPAPAAGKPIDTEALRRLRKLAATAQGDAQSAGVPVVEDDARVQHRKGQPPRPFKPATVQDAQRVWPPAAKPATSAGPANPAAGIRPVREIQTEDKPPAEVTLRAEGMPSVEGKPAADRPAEVRAAGEGKPAADRRAEFRAVGEGKPTAGRPVEGKPASEGKAVREARPAIRAVATDGQGVQPSAPVPVPRPGERETRVRRVESVVGRDSGGWRRIAQVVVGGNNVRGDGSEVDEARARAVFGGSRRIVVLGCTGGAGQSTTALMLGHTLAHYRDDRVLAVDGSTGGNTLTSRIKADSPETLTSLLSGLDRISGYLTMRAYTTRTASGLEVIGADTEAGAEQRLADRSLFSDHRLGQAMHLLDRHYKLAVIDPAAALAARILPYADQLVLVVPASEDAAEAVAMTYEWLDGHGCGDLRRRAVMVVNGVSRRSMADVEQAESVASGRCRAIVRVPWEDDLASGAGEPVDPGQLRAAGRRAYLALAGVVVAGFATAQAVRPSEEELASDPPGTRIGER